MVLRPLQVFGLQSLGVQSFINIAVESQHRRSGVVWGERGGPGFEAIGIQLCQRRTQVHQVRNLLGRLLFQGADQVCRLRHKLWRTGLHRWQRGFVIEGFGR